MVSTKGCKSFKSFMFLYVDVVKNNITYIIL